MTFGKNTRHYAGIVVPFIMNESAVAMIPGIMTEW